MPKIIAEIEIPSGGKCISGGVYCIGITDMSSMCEIFNEHLEFFEDTYDPSKCAKCLKAISESNQNDIDSELKARIKKVIKKNKK